MRAATAVPATSGPQVGAGTPVQAAVPAHDAEAPVDHRVKEKDPHHPLKWLCIGLGIVIALIVIVNYFLVDMPAGFQPVARPVIPTLVPTAISARSCSRSVLIIHVPASAALTPDTLTDFLVALAHSTPNSPFSGEPFTRVALTSGWTAQYSFSGYSWKELGDMANAPDSERKGEIMTRMDDASGQSILPESTLNDQAQASQREIVWAAFVNHFTASH